MKTNRKMYTILLTMVMALSFIPTFTMAVSATPSDSAPIESAFTDPAFLEAVREIVGKTNGEHIYRSDVENITELNVVDKNIVSLDGIEYFTRLEELYCYDNYIVVLDLSHNSKLEILDCSYNTDIESIDISNCPELRWLDCNFTTLEQLDVRNNTNLTRLVAFGTCLRTLNVSNNPLLETLDVYDAYLVSLDVSNNNKLTYLDCSYNNMCSIKSVKGLENCDLLEEASFFFEPQNEEIEHCWDSGRVTATPTAITEGEKTYTCTSCGATKTEEIPATGGSGGGSVTPPPITEERPKTITAFRDIPTNAWYNEAVSFVTEKGLMNGTGTDTFAPGDNLTRGMLVQIFYNHEGKPAITAQNIFTDVQSGAWYTDAITWAAQKGIVSGYSNGLYGPNDNVTREQFAAILWRYAGRPASSADMSGFGDFDKAGDYALTALQWAVETGIISGKGNGTLDPTGNATRAEVAQMLMNYFK